MEPRTKTLAEVEKEHILAVYEKNEFDKPETARELDISLKTLYNKLQLYERQRINQAKVA